MVNSDTAIIIPVFNEGKMINQVLQLVLSKFKYVICVNDGSIDDSSERVAESKAILVEHPINLGQGAALQTGIDYALQLPEIKYFVTFDADGQHDINDVEKMLKTLKQDKLDIVLGSRFLGLAKNISKTKHALLKLAVTFTNRFSHVNLTDTHNGLRVFNRQFAETLAISMPGMAHASEIIDRLSDNEWRYKEVPITISYSDYSRANGQSMLNSVNIIFDLILERLGRR